MLTPPSLDLDVTDRAFRATNGELGLRLADAALFLGACRRDRVKVYGWELWVIDHRWDASNGPVVQHGSWCGGIPMKAGGMAIFAGEGDADATEKQLSNYNFDTEIAPAYLSFVRVNFTLGD